MTSLVELAEALKVAKKTGTEPRLLAGKNIALIFEKSSTRTRCAFEVAAADQGANTTYLDPKSSQLGHKESVADTARVLSRFYDAIEFRGAEHALVEELASHSDVPVYTPREAGQRLSRAARAYDFALFEHWITDYIGHRGSLSDGISVMEQFDQVLAGVLDEWDLDRDLVVVTSDHGNLEDLSHRHHTYNRVPTLVLGAEHAAFDDVQDLTGLVPAMRRALWH